MADMSFAEAVMAVAVGLVGGRFLWLVVLAVLGALVHLLGLEGALEGFSEEV